jgi:hypothetical protein
MNWKELEWERGDRLSYDPEEREACYIMNAEKDGVEYEGTGVYSCGELIEVTDITETTINN